MIITISKEKYYLITYLPTDLIRLIQQLPHERHTAQYTPNTEATFWSQIEFNVIGSGIFSRSIIIIELEAADQMAVYDDLINSNCDLKVLTTVQSLRNHLKGPKYLTISA